VTSVSASDSEGLRAVGADMATRLGHRWPDRGPMMTVLEWALWLYSAVLFAGNGPTGADLHLHLDPLRSTEGVAAAVHAAPFGPAQAGLARTMDDWSRVRTPPSSPLQPDETHVQALPARVARTVAPVRVPDVAGIPLGFLTDRSLAPPRPF
jgi:hypothetical protein